jgi:hypothetical protein
MLLSDDKKRYGMKEGGPGIEALRKEAPEVVERMGYEEGGILKDDRETYAVGSIVSRLANKVMKKTPTNNAGTRSAITESEASIQNEMSKNANDLKQRGFSDERIEELLEEAYELGEPNDLIIALQQPIIRKNKAEGGELENQMSMLMPDQPQEEMLPETPMESDEDMEDNYLDFIIDEALSEEEEDMLMSKLEQDEQLSMLFDKVIEVASEFAGSGPVEGPGTGVSDSIPARLSDGEFVFTAKSVEEIGADNLMAMMKDAEMKADDRQGLAEGGEPEEEETVVMPVEQPASQQDIRVTKTTVGAQASQQEQDDLVDDEVKKSMLRGSRNLG